MKSRKFEKIKLKILEALEPKAKLSTNRGRVIDDPIRRKLTRKDRKHSGHHTIFFEDDEGYVTQYDNYDDWDNYRDGLRYNPDATQIRSPRACCRWHEGEIKQMNEKLKKKEQIRRLMKK